MEIIRALAVLAEPPTDRSAELAALVDLSGVPDVSDHTELFTFQLYPYASVYTGVEGALGGEARDRVAGFWRALSLEPPSEPDHLTTLLGLYAEICERERQSSDDAPRRAWAHARSAMLWEHLLSWLGPYLAKMEDLAPPFYRQWAALLRTRLWHEAAHVPRPAALPLHLRAADAATAEGPDETTRTAWLLAPVLSGMILTRHDIATGARELGLGLRAGERRYALEALLGQEPSAVVQWLSVTARASAERHAQDRAALGPIAEWWQARALATAARIEGAD